MLVGTTSANVVDRLHTLFEHSFGVGFERLGAGQQMFRLAETRGRRPVATAALFAGTAAQMLFFLYGSAVLWLTSAMAIVLGAGAYLAVVFVFRRALPLGRFTGTAVVK